MSTASGVFVFFCLNDSCHPQLLLRPFASANALCNYYHSHFGIIFKLLCAKMARRSSGYPNILGCMFEY